MRIRQLLAIAAFVFPFAGSAQTFSEGLACFENLAAPDYPKAALQALVDGTVWTTTQVSPQGKVEKVETQVVSAWSDGAKLLAPAVESAIRNAKIKPECAGKNLSAAFRFELYGEPVDNPKVTTRSDAPGVLWIESQPASVSAVYDVGSEVKPRK